ncbi:MAG: Rrf2 family transcriptional regulator [Deltaproteobacteria bacterium]|nr:Rrf2 family transcriptional regulator [Deltaproteobacteria bacterium]
MLKLSKKTDYAIVALSHLYEKGNPASAREIASFYNLSSPMLSNVMKLLSSFGVVSSKRGVAGGYTLGKAPGKIFLGELIEIIDGPMRFSDCADNNYECRAQKHCPAKLPIEKIHRKIKSFMDSLSLEDMINDKNLEPISPQPIN